jgi:hypothetical protein
MEYGLIPSINQYAGNNKILIQQILPSNEIAKLKEGKEAEEISREKFLKSEEVEETSEVTPQVASQYQEVVLTNLNFGFNDSSRDFFVRAIRGEAENQFPTDDIMRLRAYFIALTKAEA